MAPLKDRPHSERQKAALTIAAAMVASAGYEILDQGDGEVARNLAKRATEIADTVIDTASGPSLTASRGAK